jgi:hypothetical protein
MAASFGAIFVRTDDCESVKKAAASSKIRCLVAPVISGWVAVYPEQDQDSRLAGRLSKRMDEDVLYCALFDEDVFCYAYYSKGGLVDRYNSCPDYFERKPGSKARKSKAARGDPSRMSRLLPAPDRLSELRAVLDEARFSPAAAWVGFERFAKLFGLPNAQTRYVALMGGETEGIERWSEFTHVPDRGLELARAAQVEAEVERARTKLKDRGLLLFDDSKPDTAGFPPHVYSCPDRRGRGFFFRVGSLFRSRSCADLLD